MSRNKLNWQPTAQGTNSTERAEERHSRAIILTGGVTERLPTPAALRAQRAPRGSAAAAAQSAQPSARQRPPREASARPEQRSSACCTATGKRPAAATRLSSRSTQKRHRVRGLTIPGARTGCGRLQGQLPAARLLTSWRPACPSHPPYPGWACWRETWLPQVAAAVRSLPPPPALCRATRPRRRYAGRLVRARCWLDPRGPRRAPIGRASRPSAIRPPPLEAALRRRPGHVPHGAAAAWGRRGVRRAFGVVRGFVAGLVLGALRWSESPFISSLIEMNASGCYFRAG